MCLNTPTRLVQGAYIVAPKSCRREARQQVHCTPLSPPSRVRGPWRGFTRSSLAPCHPACAILSERIPACARARRSKMGFSTGSVLVCTFIPGLARTQWHNGRKRTQLSAHTWPAAGSTQRPRQAPCAHQSRTPRPASRVLNEALRDGGRVLDLDLWVSRPTARTHGALCVRMVNEREVWVLKRARVSAVPQGLALPECHATSFGKPSPPGSATPGTCARHAHRVAFCARLQRVGSGAREWRVHRRTGAWLALEKASPPVKTNAVRRARVLKL